MKRVLLALALTTPLLGVVMTNARAATAVTVAAPVGHIWSAVQNTFTHRLTLTGWAYDSTAKSASVTVRLVVDGRYATTARADDASAALDRELHLSGAHRFAVTVPWSPTAKSVVLKSRGVNASAPLRVLATRAATHYYPSAGTRIIDVAKRYVGDRYVDDGASPAGFDCSGYTMYAYETARVHSLPHNAESQRERMRPLARTSARPGDLVFYMSGGTAYHVAIYAGHGWQYAAATPADGVRYQRVWSSAVQYRTDWH